MHPGKVLVIVLLCLSGVASPAADEQTNAMIRPEWLRDDVRFLMQTLEEVHPNLYFKVSKTEISRRLKDLNDGLTNSLTAAEFYYRVTPLVEGFGDLHTTISRPAGATNVSKTPYLRITIPNYRWKFEILDTNIGYLDFVGMAHRDEFGVFLKETFGTIREQRLRGLIIDLRKDTGGDSSLGDDLLDHFNEKPYRPIARKDWRFSRQFISAIPQNLKEYWTPEIPANLKEPLSAKPGPELKDFLAQNPTVELKQFLDEQAPTWLKDYLKTNAPHWLDPAYSPETQKEILTDLTEMRQPPAASPLLFKGPVCFLVGPATFSSGVVLANSVEDFHLATLIGQETEEPCNQFGEIIRFRLPHSGLGGWVSTAQLVRANGDAINTRGVVPDIEVKPTESDRERGIDSVLEAAKRWIRDQSGNH